MKKTSLHLLMPLLLIGALFLLPDEGYCQTRPTAKESTAKSPRVVSVTKEIVIERGGMTLTTLSGDITYEVLTIDSERDTSWERDKESTGDGKLTTSEKTVPVCIPDAFQVKLRFTAPCDGCAVVSFTDDCK